MTYQETILSTDQKEQILREIVTCFEKAKDDREAIFSCNTQFLQKFCKAFYGSPPEDFEFASEALRITNILFQESLESEEPVGKEYNELCPDEQIYYKIQLKKTLI